MLPAASQISFQVSLPDFVPALLAWTKLSGSCFPAASQISCQVCCQMLSQHFQRKPGCLLALICRQPASLNGNARPREARPETARLLPNSLSDILPEFLQICCQIDRQISCKVFCQICCQMSHKRVSIVVDRFLPLLLPDFLRLFFFCSIC